MESEKLYGDVLKEVDINDEFFKLVIPTYGDRIAIKTFARKGRNNCERKQILLEKLKNKMSKNDNNFFGSYNKENISRGPNALKATRMIEIDWMHYETSRYQQVRTVSGGGTRKLVVNKTDKKSDLMKVAVDLFFPDGNSPKGKLFEFFTKLMDFKKNEIDSDSTVEEMYTQIKMPTMRFYLATKKIPSTAVAGSSYSSDLDDNVDLKISNLQSTKYTSTSDTTQVLSIDECSDCFIEKDSASTDMVFLTSGQNAWQQESPMDHVESSPYIFCVEVNEGEHEQSKSENSDNLIPFELHGLSSGVSDLENIDKEPEKDYELTIAIQESLKHSSTSLQIILEELSKNIVEGCTLFNITRMEPFAGAIRAMSRKSFNPNKKPSIMFTDDYGVSEGAIDSGGPTREFFRLVLKELQDSIMFEGPDTEKTIHFRNDLLVDNKYFHAGTLISMSLLHGGPGPRFLSRLFYLTLVGSDVSIPLEEVYDEDIRKEVENFEAIESLDELNKFLSSSVLFNISGCPLYVDDISKKSQLVEGVIRFVTLHRKLPAIQQMIEGLKSLNVHEKMLKYPYIFEEAFCYEEIKLTNKIINDIIDIQFSETGSNKCGAENRTIGYFRDFLIDCEENEVNVSLKDVLSFITGADSIPALGFSSKIQVKFSHDDSIFPKANTCAISIQLPTRFTTYIEFKEKVVYAIQEGMVFGFE